MPLIFSALQVLSSHLWEKEKNGGGEKKKGRREKGNRKGKEGRKKEKEKIGGKIRRNFNRNLKNT